MHELKNPNDLASYFKDKEQLVVLKFSAVWCYPCRTLSSMIRKLTHEELKGAQVLEIDVDAPEFEDMCREYNIKNIPALFFMKDNMILSKKVGSISKQEFLDTLNNTFSK